MGYYVGYQRDLYPPENIEWDGLTHIIMGRVKANADGTLNTDFDIDPTNGPLLAKDIANRAHAAGKKAILMLAGDDNSPQVAAAVKDHRALFVSNLVSTMQNLGYDGLDLDWENTINYDQFVLFVNDLRQALPTAILTMPVGALNINYDVVDPHIPILAAQLDRISIMSYFPSTSWAGSGWLSWFNCPLSGAKPATPVSIDDTLARYHAAGVPKSKLAMGISFYATCYTGGITEPNQSTENGVSIQGGDNDFMLSDLFGTNSPYNDKYRHFYDNAQPYLSLPFAERHGCKYVTYEDEESILVKGQFSRNNEYGGIIIWTINQGYVKTHSNPNFLMDALNKGFINPSVVPTIAVSIIQGNTWLNTNGKASFSALVTGTTTNRAVTWAVIETNCGSIDQDGLYKAPSTQKNCTVKATSQADPSKNAMAMVTIDNTPWTPSFSIVRSGTWWVEVTAHDPTVVSMTLLLGDGTSSALFLHYTQYGTNYPVFVANVGFPDGGGNYAFIARSSNNRAFTTTLAIPSCTHGADGLCQ